MQVAILCGGRGTRIRGEAENAPKPMVKIGGYPMLWHIMKIYAHFGHTQFIPMLGFRSWDFKEYFLNYHAMQSDLKITLGKDGVTTQMSEANHDEIGWDITLAETGVDSMTGARLKKIEKHITDDVFMMTYGDGVAEIDIDALVAFHKSHGKIATLTAVGPPSRFGDLEIDGGLVNSFQEKPQATTGRINGGYFVLNREVFDYLDDSPDLVFEREPLQNLARDGQLMAFEHDGFWLPMDTFKEWDMLEGMWNSGKAPWKMW